MSWTLGRTVAATLCAVALGAMAASGPTRAAAADWQLQAQIPGESFRPHLPLLGISCPSASLCVAVGELDEIVSSSNPTGGASAWAAVQPTGEAESDCHEDWVPHCMDPKSRRIRSIACPSLRLCVAVTGEGYVYSTTNPTGSAADWNVADVDGTGRDTHLLSVSCPTVSLCVAVSGERYTSGKVLTSTDPTGGASAWTVTQLDPTLDLRGVSCGTPTLCVAVSQQGRMLVSTNPTGGASAWQELGAPGGAANLQGVSCAATALCVAGNANGRLLTSTSPGAASSWQAADDGAAPVQVTGVSCLPSGQCLAVDDNGDVITSIDPTGGSGSWRAENLLPYVQPTSPTEGPLNALFGVSCASSSFCAVSGSDGQIFTSTDPFAATSPPTVGSGGNTRKHRRRRRPRTTIAKLILPSGRELPSHRRGRVIVRFFANGPVRRFECRLNGSRFRPCHSPKRFTVARKGTYAFRVRAVGPTGLRGPVAIKRFWTGRRCTKHYCVAPDGELPLK